ncbi:glycosyltransferase family 4 protein [Pedobacter mendelii]|uniref:Mannosyltransferase n=1 Tax=Pedobacter mendelii TaxID=1908240 RepID=A0ABQ2BKR9_9SPHI|nr:glycosyltransferase family 1 protein [Pedobacter mendelii]GGI28223.1 mannosyltransferase [Pedobacter mendelii]
MKIHYDNLIYSLQHAGGISTYWSELTWRLLRDNEDITFTESVNQNLARVTLPILDVSISHPKNKQTVISRFERLSLPFKAPFIFHSSYNRVTNNPFAKQVITIHDFVHEKFYSGIRRYLHLHQKNKSIKASSRIITVSENTKKDLLNYHPYLSENDVSVIYNGVSSDFYPLAKNEIEKPYLLFIGSRAYYKNFNLAIDVVRKHKEFDLYIVGSTLTKKEIIELNKKLPGQWKLFSGIDNIKLNELYNNAFSLLYPSSYEGFGIPLLEAMKAGVPFIALNKSSIPEVAGNAGVLVDELDIHQFSYAINEVERNRTELIKKGFLQAEKFSWEKCYLETKAVYQSLG